MVWEGALFWGGMALLTFGLVAAAGQVVGLVRALRRPPPALTYLVLVRDQVPHVEGVVRALAAEEAAELLLVDLGSADESAAILERLAQAYEHARLLSLPDPEAAGALQAALATTVTPLVVLVNLTRSFQPEKGKNSPGGES